jgi:SPP1 gp7 family putative phage head morphogenesis protein
MDGRITRDAQKAKLTLIDFGEEDPGQARANIGQQIEQRSAEEINKGFQSMLSDMFPDGAADDSPEKIAARVKKNTRANGKVKAALIKALQESTDLGVSFSVKQLGDSVAVGFDWTLVLSEARDWAQKYAGELIKQIDETSKAHVQAHVARWFDEGKPLQSLINDLTPLFGENRAQLIAVTESTKAAAMGQQMSLAASGVCNTIIWAAVGDELVCSVCGPRDGTTSPLDKPNFDGIGLPPAHPRCRCFIRPSLD